MGEFWANFYTIRNSAASSASKLPAQQTGHALPHFEAIPVVTSCTLSTMDGCANNNSSHTMPVFCRKPQGVLLFVYEALRPIQMNASVLLQISSSCCDKV
jgi:hypothetical protein